MKRWVGFMVLALVMLIPFRMVFIELGKHSNPSHVLLFLTMIIGIAVAIYLMSDKNVKNEKH